MTANDRECGKLVRRESAETANPAGPPPSAGNAPHCPSDDACLHNPLNPGVPCAWIRELTDLAANSSPTECCGLVLADGIRPCRNAMPGHQARSAYLFSPADAIWLAENAESGAILAIYHSHPKGPADWSDADERSAWFAGKPLYPAIPRWIIGCRDGKACEIAQYEFNGTAWRPTWRTTIRP